MAPAALHVHLACTSLALAGSVLAQETRPAKPTRSAEWVLEESAPLVEPLIESRVCVGLVVGVFMNGRSAVRGFGRVVKTAPTPPDGKTVYEIGSITKVFTGILLADAVQRGHVRLDDPLQKHLPADCTAPTYAKAPIRLRHLTSHSSALPRMPPNFAPADPNDPYVDYSAALLYEGLGAIRLERKPGNRFVYSNLGAGLLGQVLTDHQKLASYEALLRERVCGPLGLDDTRITLTESMRRRLAPPYNDARQRRHSWNFAALAGAGAIRSSVDDLLRFVAANLEPGDLKGPAAHLPDALARARKPVYTPSFLRKLGNEPTIGCGWFLDPKRHLIWHNGATGGYRAYLRIDTEAKSAVVVLANSTTRWIDSVSNQIAQLTRGEQASPSKIRRPIEVDSKTLKRYVGKYRGKVGLFDVRVEDGVLMVRLGKQPFHPVFPSSATRFFYRVVPAEIEFDVQGDRVTQITLFQHGNEMPAKRIE